MRGGEPRACRKRGHYWRQKVSGVLGQQKCARWCCDAERTDPAALPPEEYGEWAGVSGEGERHASTAGGGAVRTAWRSGVHAGRGAGAEPEEGQVNRVLDVIAAALAEHQQSYEPADLPTGFHGYAHAVLTGLESHGWRVTPPDVDAERRAMWDTEGRTGVTPPDAGDDVARDRQQPWNPASRGWVG
jgi:hypothetical protein